DVAQDALDVLPLGDRIAVARRAALEVLDVKTGAIAFTAADLSQLKALYAVNDVLYGLGPRRIAVIDAETVRALKWIELGSPANGFVAAAEERLALAPAPADQAVVEIDLVRHAEVERFHFDERVQTIAVDDRGAPAVGTIGDPRAPRPGDDAVL